MSLYRSEYNCTTGELREVAQRAYQNSLDAADVIILDLEQPAPLGYITLTDKQFKAFKEKELEITLSLKG